MGSRRDEWPALVAGIAIPGLYRLADDGHALGGTTAAPGSTTSDKSTGSQPASKGTAGRASSCTTTDASSGMVAVAQAGQVDTRTPSASGTYGASQSSLWGVVPSERPVYRNAAQAAGGATAAVALCGASERFERTEELGGRDGARLCRG